MPETAAPPVKPPTPRERARARTIGDIVRIGREQLALHGAAALSLRAVARELGVVSSAVYRYVESREELLTLLLVDAYNELGDAVDAAVGALPERRFQLQVRGARGRRCGSWALREPASYALLFGSPVPGYRAPAERTIGPGTRVVVALMAILDGAWPGRAPRRRKSGCRARLPAPLAADLAKIRADMGLAVPDPCAGARCAGLDVPVRRHQL